MRYLIPFSYMIKTRYSTFFYKIAFVLVYFLPIIIVCRFFYADLLSVAVSLIGINCLYEEGYLDNDLITSKYEINPTVRLQEKERQYFEKNYIILKAGRISLFLIIVLVYTITDINSAKIMLTGGVALIISYALHNTIRSRKNIITFTFLVTLKYLLPVLCGRMEVSEIQSAFSALFFVICIPRIFEYSLKYTEKYRSLLNKKKIMRIIYYLFIVFLTGIKFLLTKKVEPIFLLSIYYFIFRVIDIIRTVRR